MARYELTLVLTPTLMEEEVPGALERVRHLISDRGGTLESEDVQGRRRLEYPVRKQRMGTFVLSRLDLPTAAVREIEAGLRLDERVLRHLLIRVQP